MSKALKREGENDYRLKEDYDSVWITVGLISVYVRRVDGAAAVTLYPLEDEMGEELDKAIGYEQ